MLERKKRGASNTWYKKGRPIITSGDEAGQRDQERIMARIQVIPEDSFNEYGDRKVTGFTLTEIAHAEKTGEEKILYANAQDAGEGVVLARLSVGPADDQFTREELKTILIEMRGLVLSTVSPTDAADRQRLHLEKDMQPKAKGGRPKKIVVVADIPADGPAEDGTVDSPDSAT